MTKWKELYREMKGSLQSYDSDSEIEGRYDTPGQPGHVNGCAITDFKHTIPTIVHSETILCNKLTLINYLREHSLPRRYRADPELTQFGEDVYFSYNSIRPHTDNTAPGLITYGCILINDPGFVLVYDGVSYEIPPGSMYQMDARIEHALLGSSGGLFAAIIWDMPPKYGLANFELDLIHETYPLNMD